MSTDPGTYPECKLIVSHAGDCDYRLRYWTKDMKPTTSTRIDVAVVDDDDDVIEMPKPNSKPKASDWDYFPRGIKWVYVSCKGCHGRVSRPSTETYDLCLKCQTDTYLHRQAA